MAKGGNAAGYRSVAHYLVLTNLRDEPPATAAPPQGQLSSADPVPEEPSPSDTTVTGPKAAAPAGKGRKRGAAAVPQPEPLASAKRAKPSPAGAVPRLLLQVFGKGLSW
jgi:hypothetical protein